MSDVSIVRLYVLRAMYLVMAVGLAVDIWPEIFAPPANLSHMATVVRSVLGAIGILAAIGVRYPLKMLPLLIFELVWKATWVLAFGLPLWREGRLNADTRETFNVCLVSVVLVALVVPWGYAFREYVKAPGDRWTRA